jgi:uncharacterized protein
VTAIMTHPLASYPVVDAHCHAGTGDGLSGPWDTRASLGPYRVRAAAAGIRHTVLIPVFTSDYVRANEQVASIIARDPNRFSGLAMVHPSRDAGRVVAMLSDAVFRLGLRGVKVHRHDAPITREICSAARRLDLPILYDVMGEIGQVELLAREFPGLRLIIPHLGSFGDDWRAQHALLPLLERFGDLYADTSGVRRFDVLLEAARRVPGKLLFGSDGPWLHPGLELAKVRALGLSSSAYAAVAGGTTRRLFRLGTQHPRAMCVPPMAVRGSWASRMQPPASVADPWLSQEVTPE